MADKQQQQEQKNSMSYLQVPDIHNNNNNNNNVRRQQISSQQQQQQHIQKKHSGPLDAALNELRRQEEEEKEKREDGKKEEEEKEVTPTTTTTILQQSFANTDFETATISSSGCRTHSHTHTHTHGHLSKKESRKRERWLLTRKTWKFMQDAGRKLLPDGVQNRKEDIPFIEAHFQQMCNNEQRFLLWRRKVSFPGARRNSLRNSLRRLPGIKRHQRNNHKTIENEADQMLNMLKSYLQITDSGSTTTALLSSKTQQPHQTISPSAQRPVQQQQQSQNQQEQRECINRSSTMEQLEEIMNKLRELSAHSHAALLESGLPKPELITRDFLQDKTQLRQIYNALKRQQLHRQLSRHASPLLPARRRHSLTNVFGTATCPLVPGMATTTPKVERRQPPRILPLTPVCELNSTTSGIAAKAQTQNSNTVLNSDSNKLLAISATPIARRRLKLNTCGTQTNFIPLQEIKQLAAEYRETRSPITANENVDDETAATTNTAVNRKSSIENTDISPTVSDTIKRYLRMARKKSVADKDEEAKQRFKRINYDRQLRQIRARGEINPPGMDEDNHKAIQTLDAWPVIMLDCIRNTESIHLNEAHQEWEQQLNERIQRKLDYDNKMQQQQQQQQQQEQTTASTTATTTPTSPRELLSDEEQQISVGNRNSSGSTSNLLVSGQQFLSNLWHGTTSTPELCINANNQASQQNKSKFSASNLFNKHLSASDSANVNMQKSKSSSHVGHFVTKKILRNRSKSQTRTNASYTRNSGSSQDRNSFVKWAPSEHLTWTSDHGERISLKDTSLQNLSDLEYQFLKRIAMEKIIELNIGIDVNLDKEVSKKRGLLPKKRSMTTSFFDIGARKDDVCLFGNTLESCIAKDNKNWSKLDSLTGFSSERGSRNSIVSLFRSHTSSSADTNSNSKLHESVRSCESLPTNTGNNIIGNRSNKNISRSQCDIRAANEREDLTDDLTLPNVADVDKRKLQVPNFVTTCIQYLEDFGLHTVGLFRVSTSKKRVKQLRDEFDKHSVVNVEAETCPHDVATLLKEFLRDLPEPLINENLYKAFLDTIKIRNRRLQLEAISHLVKLLPVTHRDTLYVLLKFLAKVSAHADDICAADGTVELNGNRMDSYNLATVFAPNILRPARKISATSANDYSTASTASYAATQRDAGAQQQYMADAINVVRTLIDHYEEIFRVPAELIHTIYAHMLDTCPAELNTLCAQKSAVATELNETKSTSLPTSPTMPMASFPITTSASKAEKKLFTRESVMHMNDATKSTFGNLQPFGAGKRTRSIKSSKTLRRQSTPTDFGVHAEPQDHSDLSAEEEGIVTASLQISMAFNPITKSATTTTTTNNNETDKIIISGEQRTNFAMTPPAPASISNIGDAILRSKKADFERISAASILNQQQQQLYKLQQQQQQQRVATVSTTTPTTSTLSSMAEVQKRSITSTSCVNNLQQQQQTSQLPQQQQQLYKRQQLIRSAKKTFSSNK